MDTQNSNLKVAVLMGGIGSERQISIQSGNCVADALRQAGFEVIEADIGPDNLTILDDKTIDIFFPALHGEFGEDGRLQQILEDKSLLYVGSGPTASETAFNKMISKRLFTEAGVAVPDAIEYDTQIEKNELEEQLRYLTDKYVVKPINQGSSVGVSITSTKKETIKMAEETFQKFGDCMIEQFIPGKEITVGILNDKTLPIIEIQSQTGFYDYQAKYINEQTEYLFDTIKNPALIAQIEQQAFDCFYALGCRHFARVDFILSEDNIPYVLEVNTIPGFTRHSLLPKAAAKAGFSMSQLCKEIIETTYSSLVEYQA
jgi:D-alanine-D-alanine ligase